MHVPLGRRAAPGSLQSPCPRAVDRPRSDQRRPNLGGCGPPPPPPAPPAPPPPPPRTSPPTATLLPTNTPTIPPSPTPTLTSTPGASPTPSAAPLPTDDPRAGINLSSPDYRDAFDVAFTWFEYSDATVAN